MTRVADCIKQDHDPSVFRKCFTNNVNTRAVPRRCCYGGQAECRQGASRVEAAGDSQVNRLQLRRYDCNLPSISNV